jgi:hypothetical protein
MLQTKLALQKFDVFMLNGNEDNCICSSSKRFSMFLDDDTSNNINKWEDDRGHIRTMDLSIIQHKGLRHALKMGLNQIPLRPTIMHETIQMVCNIFYMYVRYLTFSI